MTELNLTDETTFEWPHKLANAHRDAKHLHGRHGRCRPPPAVCPPATKNVDSSATMPPTTG
jgi:hypothetical protein